ncbi:MAG: hypothetical protein U0Q22_16335 [Acidimicrobiales bacterium]
MRALPTRRRVVPTAIMALGFSITLAGSFGFSPLSSADEGPVVEAMGQHQSDGVTTTVHDSGGLETTTTTCPPSTTTTVPETTTTVAKTTTTVPQTTTTVAKTTTTVAQTTTTAAVTTTTIPTKVLPTTTVKVTTTPVKQLAVTGSSSSMPMVGAGISMFVLGLILLELRAVRAT